MLVLGAAHLVRAWRVRSDDEAVLYARVNVGVSVAVLRHWPLWHSPRIQAPSMAEMPPTMCTTPQPAKSITPTPT